MSPLPVVNGHEYVVTTDVVTPAGQQDPTGATQAFLVQVSP
jgi:hypothetical protein